MPQPRKSAPTKERTELVSVRIHLPKEKHDELANMARADRRKIKHMTEVLVLEGIEKGLVKK